MRLTYIAFMVKIVKNCNADSRLIQNVSFEPWLSAESPTDFEKNISHQTMTAFEPIVSDQNILHLDKITSCEIHEK